MKGEGPSDLKPQQSRCLARLAPCIQSIKVTFSGYFQGSDIVRPGVPNHWSPSDFWKTYHSVFTVSWRNGQTEETGKKAERKRWEGRERDREKNIKYVSLLRGDLSACKLTLIISCHLKHVIFQMSPYSYVCRERLEVQLNIFPFKTFMEGTVHKLIWQTVCLQIPALAGEKKASW